MKQRQQLILALTAALTAALPLPAAMNGGGAVGLATRPVRINASLAAANATLLNGNVVETTNESSELRLRGGAVLMDRATRVRVFDSRTELEAGKVQVQGTDLHAGSLRVNMLGSASEATVVRTGADVRIGSLRGDVTVTRKGVLVAKLTAGNELSFRADEYNPAPAAETAGTNDSGSPADDGAPPPSPTTAGKKGLSKAAKSWITVGALAGVGVTAGTLASMSR